jgi:hypothetical protein
MAGLCLIYAGFLQNRRALYLNARQQVQSLQTFISTDLISV